MAGSLSIQTRVQKRGTIGHVKRPALRIEDARGAFNNKPVQIARPNRFAKRFAKP